MAEETGTNREITPLKKPSIYTEFILWTAMPYGEKEKLGLETQEQFCEFYKIGKNTPASWKERHDFEQRVDAILKMWSTDKTPDVVHSIYRTAVKGNPLSQMLWLKYFKKFTEKSEVTVTKKVEFGVNDVRFLIEGLPEPLRSEHYGNLRKLIDDASMVRRARDSEGMSWRDGPAPALLDQPDHDAQDVRSERGDGVAESDSPSVRFSVVRTIPASDNKSPSRRWQE